MHHPTVRRGINFLIAAIGLIIVGSYYPATVARLMFIGSFGSDQIISLAFFWGGLLAGIGILLTIIGCFRRAGREPRRSLLPPVLMLIGMVLLFFVLFFSMLGSDDEVPSLRPGETIII